MDRHKSEDHEFVDMRIKRRRRIWLSALVLASLIALLVLTADKVRELAERIVTPEEYRPIPMVYNIKGYPAASERAFEEFLSHGDNRERYAKLEKFLQLNRVDKVVPSFELLRQGSDWQKIAEPPFAMPPQENWKTIVDTLRAVRDEVIPRIGPVIVLSGWRTGGYNTKAGGAKTSKHMHFCGLDMVPQQKFSRRKLLRILRDIHRQAGRKWNMGLGIYSGIRFHVDTCGYRRW